MAVGDKDVGKLLKEVECVLSAREKQYKKDIRDRDTQIANLKQQVHNANDVARSREDQIRSLQDELDRLMNSQRKELENYQTQLDQLREKHAQLLLTHNDAKAKHSKRYDKVVKQRDKLAAEVSTLDKELVDRNNHNADLEKKLLKAGEEQKDLTGQVLSLDTEVRRLSDRNTVLRGSNDCYRSDLAAANKKLEDTKKDHMKRVRDLESKIKSVRDDSNSNVDNIRKALEKQQDVTKTLTEENVGYRRQLAERCCRLEHLEVDNSSLRNELKLLQKQVKTAQTDCCQHRERVEQLLSTVDRQQEHINSLEATERQAASLELTAAREELAQTRNEISRLQQNDGHLRQLLEESESRHTACVNECSSLRGDLKHALSEVMHFQKMVLTCEQEHGHLTKKVKTAERLGKQQAKAQLDDLTIRLAETQSESLRYQQALQKAQQKARNLESDNRDLQGRFEVALGQIGELRLQLQDANNNPSSSTTTTSNSGYVNPIDEGLPVVSSSFPRLPSKINPAVVGLKPRKPNARGPPLANAPVSSSTGNTCTTTTTMSSTDSLPGPVARGDEASVDSAAGHLSVHADGLAHEPSEGSVVNQLLTELSTALAPQSISATSRF